MNRNQLPPQNSISFILFAEKIISTEKPESQKLLDQCLEWKGLKKNLYV